MPELLFLAPRDGVSADLSAALCREVARQDAAGRVVSELPAPGLDRVHIVLGGEEDPAATAVLPDPARSIFILLASPGTAAFESGVELAKSGGAVFHVNSAATESLLELGVPARHLQLGFAEGCGAFDPQERVQLAVLRGAWFDWPRALAAMHRGSVVLHERSLGVAPLAPARHLFFAPADAIDQVAAALEKGPERLQKCRLAALDFIRTSLPLAIAGAALIGAARTLVAQPLPAGSMLTPGQTTPSSK